MVRLCIICYIRHSDMLCVTSQFISHLILYEHTPYPADVVTDLIQLTAHYILTAILMKVQHYHRGFPRSV